MSHSHSHAPIDSLGRLVIAIVINSGIVVFEIVFGIITGSVALISDAVHNLSDISAMILGYIAEKIARRPTNARKTYGYHKIEFIIAFANAILLAIAIGFVFFEALERLLNPVEVGSQSMFYVALVALIGNSLATLILQKVSTQNFNLKAVWLHSLQDALLSLGVLIASIIIHFTQWNFIDPLISIFIALFIAKEIYKIGRATVNALLDAVPENLDFEEIKKDLLNLENVKKVNDLHIWQSGSHKVMLSAHLRAEKDADNQDIIRKAQHMLCDTYKIEHTTLQVIPFGVKDFLHCNHCN